MRRLSLSRAFSVRVSARLRVEEWRYSKPAQALDGLAIDLGSFSPLLLAYLIDRVVERFDDMETIEHQGGVGTMVFDRPDVGPTHVAAGGVDLGFLVGAQGLIEEPFDALAAFARADPDHHRALEVIDQRGVLMALVLRHFINAESLQTADAVPLAQGVNRAVQQIGERRGRHT